MNRQPHAPTKAKISRAIGQPRTGFRMPPKHKPCGKRRCATYEDALAYLLRLSRLSKDPLRIYECPTCSGWHLTKRPDWEDPR